MLRKKWSSLERTEDASRARILSRSRQLANFADIYCHALVTHTFSLEPGQTDVKSEDRDGRERATGLLITHPEGGTAW